MADGYVSNVVLQFIFFTCVFFIASPVYCARKLYKDTVTGEYGELIMDAENRTTTGNGNGEFKPVPPMSNFKYFGDIRKGSEINVHMNGFISFSLTTSFSLKTAECQRRPDNNMDLLPVYWANYDSGHVYYFKHSKQNNRLSKTDLGNLAKDLTDTFTKLDERFFTRRPPVHVDEIEEVLVVTWYNMFANVNTKTLQRKRHRFQALIVNVKNTKSEEGVKYYSYVQIYYAQLDSNGNWDPAVSFANQRCKQAQFGVSVDTRSPNNFNGVYNPGFPLPSIAECLTNEMPYDDLGSWVYDVTDNKVVRQPVPSNGRCDTTSGMMDPKCYLKGFAEAKREKRTTTPATTEPPKPTKKSTTTTTTPMPTKPTTIPPGTKTATTPPRTPKTTTTTTTTTTKTRPTFTTRTTRTTTPIDPIVDERVRRLADKYCKNRDAGLYQIPVICDVFVSCSLGGKAEPMVCPEGTNFNPEFQTCDHSDNFECHYNDANLTELTSVTAPPPKHNNLCHFLGWGEFVDPKSCGHYYACTNSRSIRMVCPAGLHFRPTSEKAGICDWKYNVQCSGDGERPPPSMPITTLYPIPPQ